MKMKDLTKMVIENNPHHIEIIAKIFWDMREVDKMHLTCNMDAGVLFKDNSRNLPARLSPGKAFPAFCKCVKRQLEDFKKDVAYPCYDCMRIAKDIGLINSEPGRTDV